MIHDSSCPLKLFCIDWRKYHCPLNCKSFFQSWYQIITSEHFKTSLMCSCNFGCFFSPLLHQLLQLCCRHRSRPLRDWGCAKRKARKVARSCVGRWGCWIVHTLLLIYMLKKLITVSSESGWHNPETDLASLPFSTLKCVKELRWT